MAGKRFQKEIIHLLSFCTVLCSVCISSGLVIRGQEFICLFPSIAFVLIVIVSCPPDDVFISFKTAYTFFAAAALAISVAFLSCRCTSVSLPFESDSICLLEGTALHDSTFSGSGNRLIAVKLSSCTDVYGDKASARGTVSAVDKGTDLITSGLGLSLEGGFSDDGLFICRNLQVTERHPVNNLRERLIVAVQRRLFAKDVLICNGSSNSTTSEEDSAVLLSLSLLTGRTENQENPLREKASLCGCVHVLALSGMHVSVLASFLHHPGKRTGKRKPGYLLSSVAVLLFVLVAGNRPSILRAVIMFFLPSIAYDERLIATFCIHAMLFPQTMNEPGCTYAYLSMAALVYLKPHVRRAFSSLVPGFILDLLVPGLCVLIVMGPLLLASESSFSTGTIIASAAASFLVRLSMYLGLLVLILGRLKILLDLMVMVYRLLDGLFDLASLMPSLDLRGYILLLFSITALVLLSQAFKEATGKLYKIDGN